MDIDTEIHKELMYLIMRFLEEQNLGETLHLYVTFPASEKPLSEKMEQESKYFFDTEYFTEMVMKVNFQLAEKYLSSFTKEYDNELSKLLYANLHHLRRMKENHDRRLLNRTASFCDDIDIIVNRNPKLRTVVYFPVVTKEALVSLLRVVCPSAAHNRDITKDIFYLIHQFLLDEGLKDTVHKLEIETKLCFRVEHIVDCMFTGFWYKAEEYLVAFDQKEHIVRLLEMFLELQYHKYLGELNEDKTRPEYIDQIRKLLLNTNPQLEEKMKLPPIERSRLKSIIKKTLNWWRPPSVVMRLNYAELQYSVRGVPKLPYLLHPSTVPANESNVSGGESSNQTQQATV